MPMKVFGLILILVTTLHSQCSGSCPLELFFPSAATVQSDVTAEPPCHRSHESSEQPSDHSPPQKDDSCGSGPAIMAKVTKQAQTGIESLALIEAPSADIIGTLNVPRL